MNYPFYIGILLLTGIFCNPGPADDEDVIKRGGVTYDFRFAALAVKYLETGDTFYLSEIAGLPAADHILNHARKFGYEVPKDSKPALIRYLLEPRVEKKKILETFKRNLRYAKEEVAKPDIPQRECLKYLPDGFTYGSTLFFTFGYDIGVVYGSNASLNLAHRHFVKDMHEIGYYAIHELHHAGFVALKNGFMPSMDISTYGQMAKFIEYYTQLEGMGTYAPRDIRTREKALGGDEDYPALQDPVRMKEYEREYFEIYRRFKNNPEQAVRDEDWERLSLLSNGNRLWYRVGALMAGTIDEKRGRKELVNLISGDPVDFIRAYEAINSRTR